MATVPSYVEEFADVATIRDKRAFNARLTKVIQREVAHALAQGNARSPTAPASFRAAQRWMPSATALQRGRAQMVRAFGEPHLLAVPDFAALAGKSRQQVYKDIESRRLLALSIGARGQRIPDWQLDELKKQLTQALLQRAADVDAWTLYHALSQPSEALAGKAPIDKVRPGNTEQVLRVVLDQLGVQD
jgi:hypothetical protein